MSTTWSTWCCAKSSCKVPTAELMRVIAPGGLLMVERAGRLEEDGQAGSCRHWMSGTSSCMAPTTTASRWTMSVLPSAFAGTMPPSTAAPRRFPLPFTSMVSANGLVFTIEDRATTEDVNAPVEYYLVARDAFNGIQLWKRPMKQWSKWQTNSIKSIPTQQQRCLAAIGNRVYCCPEFGGPVTAFESRTGAEKQVYEHTEQTAEFAIRKQCPLRDQRRPLQGPDREHVGRQGGAVCPRSGARRHALEQAHRHRIYRRNVGGEGRAAWSITARAG